MMEGETGSPTTEQSSASKTNSKSEEKELRSRRRTSASPQNDSSDEQGQEDSRKEVKSPTTRTRGHSEADKRNTLEKQRKLQREATDRDAHTNNRFLRALSGQSPVPEKTLPVGADDEDEGDDTDTTTGLLSKRNTATRTKSTEGIIVTPASGWFQRRQPNAHVAQRWKEQYYQQEAAGLFVDDERRHFQCVELSTLDRLEERLYRELSLASLQRWKQGITIPSEFKNASLQRHSGGTIVEELLMPGPQSPLSRMKDKLADEAMNEAASSQQTNSSIDSQITSSTEKKVAMLELYVDRVVLDDHPTFTLADRLAAQLRALYAAYIRMQQLQPWQISLQRLNEFFSSSTDKLADTASAMARSELSPRQVVQEVNQLLTDLEALSQLHQQIISKANELRDAGSRAGSALPLRVKLKHCIEPFDLSRVDAVLELVEVDTKNQHEETVDDSHDKLQVTSRKLAERLSALSSATAQALQTVLLLERISGENAPDELSFWTPKFYVVLRVNGKIACSTKKQPWARGEVRFAERICFTLPFFPSSVCAEVYECRRLLRDELLSTNAVPVVVPGHNVAQCAPSRARSSLLDGWGDNNEDHLVPAASLTASDEWYQFSSTSPIARKHWHISFHNAPLFSHTTRRAQGQMHLRASWIPTIDSQFSRLSTDDAAYLPPKRPESAGRSKVSSSPVQLVGKSLKRDSAHLSQYLCDSGFSSERDFLRLVEPQELPLDPNDPDNVAVRRLQVYYTQQQQESKAVGLGGRKVFRTSDVPGPLAGSGRGLTKRNRLLRLRDREHVSRHGTSFCDAFASHDIGKVEPPRWIPQHAVFDEPLPLQEHELLADERLLRLLRPELHAFDRRLLVEEAERADASIVERHRVRQLLKLQDFREKVRQTQIVSSYNTDSSNQDARAGRSKPLAALVQEKPLPLFPGTLEFPALGALFAPRRRLRPRAKAPAAVPSSQTAAHWPTACTLYVQVHKATNVPVRIKPPHSNTAEAEEIATTGRNRRDTLLRSKKSPRTMSTSERGDNQSEEVAETPREGVALEYESHVFVQIIFQGKTRQTSSAALLGTVSKSNHSGAHPMWMETLALPFRPPQDDWSPEGLESTQDTIRFNLFDQVTRTVAADEDRQEGEERLGAQTRALHRENCFLGSLEVPFLTLYRAGRLESSLRCEMPVEHLGYANLQVGRQRGATSSSAKTSIGPPSVGSSDEETGSSHHRGFLSPRKPKSPRSPDASIIDDDDGDPEGLGVLQAAREATFLKLTLLLDPILPVTNGSHVDDEKEALTSGTGNTPDKVLQAHAKRWAVSARKSAPACAARRRNYNVFVHNLSHGDTFMPRFLRAQAPPPGLQAASLRSIVRFVSLIPFLDDWLAFDGDKDVWSTTQEFLNMGAGDHEEHAVLLANYFMWYDRRHRHKGESSKVSTVYLVLGNAVPEGNIVYVLRREILWNASTGVGYAVSDSHCPLRDVSLVVCSKNVFANVQPLSLAAGGNCHELNWNIESNTKCWKPFFTGKDISLPPSIQRREVTYSETPPSFVEQVERELQEALKLAVRRWRSSHFATNFNAAAGLQLRDHLKVLEREASGQSSSHDPQSTPSAENIGQVSPRSTKKLRQKIKMKLALPARRVHPGSSILRELQRSREVCGLPLHASFTDIPRVLETVENTNIHYNERPGVEFALAVYVCGHPNSVLSVWVYFAALVPF